MPLNGIAKQEQNGHDYWNQELANHFLVICRSRQAPNAWELEDIEADQPFNHLKIRLDERGELAIERHVHRAENLQDTNDDLYRDRALVLRKRPHLVVHSHLKTKQNIVGGTAIGEASGLRAPGCHLIEVAAPVTPRGRAPSVADYVSGLESRRRSRTQGLQKNPRSPRLHLLVIHKTRTRLLSLCILVHTPSCENRSQKQH